MPHHLAASRYTPGNRTDKPTKRVDLVTIIIVKKHTCQGFQRFDLKTGLGKNGSILIEGHLRLHGLVMLVLDLADNFLDQILDCDQPVDPAKFINNKREMAAAQAHFIQQVEQPYCRGHKQRRPQQRADFRRLSFMQMCKHILDMNDAGNVIQRVAPHRQTAVIRCRHLFDDLRETFRHAHRHDIGARNHHIRCIQITQPQNIAKQRPFMMIKIRLVRIRYGQQCFQLVTPRGWLMKGRENPAEYCFYHQKTALFLPSTLPVPSDVPATSATSP